MIIIIYKFFFLFLSGILLTQVYNSYYFSEDKNQQEETANIKSIQTEQKEKINDVLLKDIREFNKKSSLRNGVKQKPAYIDKTSLIHELQKKIKLR